MYGYNFGSYGYGVGISTSLAQALIDYRDWNTTTSSEYVTDGVELVINGGFDTDSGWIKEDTWTIIDGMAIAKGFTGLYKRLRQPYQFEIGSTYKIVIECTRWVSSYVYIRKPRSSLANDTNLRIDGVGTYTYYVTVASDSDEFAMANISTASDMDISSISVQKVIEEPNKRYLKDVGSTPTYNASMYFGRGAYLNGVDQSIDIVPIALVETGLSFSFNILMSNVDALNYVFAHYLGYRGLLIQRASVQLNLGEYPRLTLLNPLVNNTFYSMVITYKNRTAKLYIDNILQGTLLFSNDATLGFDAIGKHQSSFLGGTLKDIFVFNREITQSEITQSYEQPEAFYAMAQADTTCVLNMPMCETDGYARNMKTYSEGIELLEQDTTLWKLTGGWSTDGVSLICNSSAYDIATIPDRFFYTINDIYYYKIEIFDYVSGVLQLQVGSNWVDLPKANGLYLLIFKATGTEFNLRSKGGFIGSVLTKSIKQLSGVHAITNYTSSIRDNAKNLQYGLQTCKFVRDSLGVIQSASDYLECDGVGYANSGNFLDTQNDFSIEFIGLFKTSTVEQAHGVGYIDAYNRITFGIDTVGKLFSRCGGTIIAYNSNSFYNICSSLTLTFNRTLKQFKVYFNGVYAGKYINNNFTLTKSIFTVGGQGSTTYQVNGDVRLFKVHDKELTQTEITNNYNSYVAKGLLA